MDTSKLKGFAKEARTSLLAQVASKLSLVLQAESSARREAPQAVRQLEKAVSELGKEALIDKVAYIWFNRFCALRFMDVNGYNRVGIVSPAADQVQPEILSEAKAGHIDDTLVNPRAAERVLGLLNGSIKSQDGQAEAYRTLIVAACNNYHSLMPYLFQRIDDYTELLMPDDLLSENSLLAQTREAMSAEACASVEVIGWLYQFYISEKKEKVFADLKKNKKVTAENIPAATQLFTPHWIVRYLVENSLGRLWLLNNPNSSIVQKMDYYIKPEQPESDFLRISSPEELKICDPAAGSGHMLTYAYDLLYAIYLDAGYDPIDIPELILTKNLYGIEIDERASELAAFALSMKAMKGNPDDDSNNRRRFFRSPIKPNICKLEKVTFTEDELDEYFAFVGKDLFTADLRKALKDFEEADNFGSLITPTIADVTEVLRTLEARDVSGQLFLTDTHHKVLQVLKQADYLSQKYQVVVANPPYMGSKGMNPRLSTWAKDNFPDSKSDLFAMFIERGMTFVKHRGYSAMVTMESWMFLSSFEKMRSNLLVNSSIHSLVHMPYLGKGGTSMGINFGTSAFILSNADISGVVGDYCCVRYYECDQNGVPFEFPPQNERLGKVKAEDFRKIPGSPIAYWVSTSMLRCFENGQLLKDIAPAKLGMRTGDNDKWLRKWFEVSKSRSVYDAKDALDAQDKSAKWVPYNKGGDFRRWYGNNETVVFWADNGYEIKKETLEKYPSLSWNNLGWKITNEPDFFKPSCTWTFISSSSFGVRVSPGGAIFDVAGSSAFPANENLKHVAGFLCSKVAFEFLKITAPTLNFQVVNVNSLPWMDVWDKPYDDLLATKLMNLSCSDWNAYEESWDFKILPLLDTTHLSMTLEFSYVNLREHWQKTTTEMQCLEEENNRVFIEAYGLQEDLTPEVPIEEITLICNPAYRYGIKISEEERENRLRADTMAEFLSYAVGCMFGRYSLDEPGLILANQGERLEDYLARIPSPTFMPDEDNVIPLIDFDGDWFEDDITELFKQFLKVTFGEEHFAENLAFIEGALGKDIRKYFLKDFYKDHVQRYKKRPIYWQFSSAKGTFNALIYMHRYRSDTCSLVLKYLRDFRAKLEARKQSNEQISISASASQKEKTQALKMIDKINKALDEINEYEREVMFPLAAERINIDLDDGVKHNYPLFGNALKKIAGLEGSDND